MLLLKQPDTEQKLALLSSPTHVEIAGSDVSRIAPFLTVDGRRLAPEGPPTRALQLTLPL